MYTISIPNIITLASEIKMRNTMIRKNKKIVMILFLASGLLLGGCSSSSWVGNASTWWDGTTFVGAGVNRAIDKNSHKRKPLIGKVLDGVFPPHGGSVKEWFKEPKKEICDSIDAERREILPEGCKKNNETKNN